MKEKRIHFTDEKIHLPLQKSLRTLCGNFSKGNHSFTDITAEIEHCTCKQCQRIYSKTKKP
jgi:hypothetical protein